MQFYDRLYETVYRHIYPAMRSYLTSLSDLTQMETGATPTGL